MGEYYKNPNIYDDIMNLPHFQSKERAHMSLSDRAAQFAPFAAMTGHEEAIEETVRLREKEILQNDREAQIHNIAQEGMHNYYDYKPLIIP